MIEKEPIDLKEKEIQEKKINRLNNDIRLIIQASLIGSFIMLVYCIYNYCYWVLK